MAKKKRNRDDASRIPKTEADDLVGPAIPDVVPPPTPVKPDVSEPWYRPAKQYIRREQWNRSILQLLNKLPGLAEGEERIIRYVGLPGQHHLDLLSMRGICNSKRLRVNYLGFRIGAGAPAQVTPLDQLVALSNARFHTPDSVVIPDSVENIGSINTPAHVIFRERGPFDVINLDVCGGILHGNPATLLNAIKTMLLLQNPRTQPWLLFVTTLAKPEFIAVQVLKRFFKSLVDNCTSIKRFKAQLLSASKRCGYKMASCLNKPGEMTPEQFLRYFTLAFGKWLLLNLAENSPRAVVSLQSAFGFRNTNWQEPEMLSLAFLATPITVGGKDPTKLTGHGAAKASGGDEYEQYALKLIAPALDGMQDLDEVWDDRDELRETIVGECEGLLRLIGVDEVGIQEWRTHHNLDVN